MGRGLSPLQQQILLAARRGRATRDRATFGPPEAPDALLAELLHEVLVWPLHLASQWHWRTGTPELRRGGQNFRRAQIGLARYNAGRAAVSRALARLERRGLLTRRWGMFSNWAGVRLTPAGLRVADRLSVTKVVPSPPS
jgi:hypothetical protein